MPQNIYTIRDNSSGDTFKISLDHRPSQGEIPGLIDSERLRRSQITAKGTKQISQIQSESEEPGAFERSWEFGKGELEGLGDIGKSLLEQAKQNLTGNAPKGEPIQVKLPSGKTATAYNPYANESVPVLPQLKSTYELTQQGKYGEAGKQFASAAAQGALLTAPFSGVKPENVPEVIPPKQLKSGEIKTQLGTGGNEDFIEAEVVPTESSLAARTPETKTTSPSLSTGETGIKGQLGSGTPQVEAPTQTKLLRPPSIKLGPSPLQESVFRKVTPFSEQEERPETLITPFGQNTIIPPQPFERNILPSGEKPALPSAKGRRLTPQVRGPRGKFTPKESSSIQSQPELSPIESAENLTPEQQSFVAKGGKITKVPPGKAKGAEELTGKVSGEETGGTQRNLKKRVRDLLNELKGSEEGFIDVGKIGDLIDKIKGKDREYISSTRTMLMSPSRNLELDPRTAGFASEAQRQELLGRYIANKYIDEYSDLMDGLSKTQREAVNSSVRNPNLRVNPNIKNKAIQLHQLNEKFRQAANALDRGEGVNVGNREITQFDQIGYQPNYMPNVRHVSIPGQIVEYVKSRNIFKSIETKRKTNLPISPSMMKREDKIPESELETDPNKLMPQYYSGTAIAAAKRPMVRLGNQISQGLGEGNLRTNLTNFINQYSGHDDIMRAAKQFNLIFDDLTQASTRSILFANPRVQLLHLSSLATQVLPDLGPVGFTKSLKSFASNPIKYLKLVQRFQPPHRNWAQGLGAKIDTISQFGNAGFRLGEALAFHGYYERALSNGLKGSKAIAEAMRSVNKAFGVPMPGDDPLGLVMASRLPFMGPTVTRFTRIPYNLLQNYVDAFTQKDLWTIVRYTTMGLAAYEFDKKYRVPLFHLSLKNFEFTAEQTARTLSNLTNDLYKGNLDKAKKQLLYLFEPASIRGYQREGAKGTVLEYERSRKTPKIQSPRIQMPRVVVR